MLAESSIRTDKPVPGKYNNYNGESVESNNGNGNGVELTKLDKMKFENLHSNNHLQRNSDISDGSNTTDIPDSACHILSNDSSHMTSLQQVQSLLHQLELQHNNTEMPFEDEPNVNIIRAMASVFYNNPSVNIFVIVVFLSGKE